MCVIYGHHIVKNFIILRNTYQVIWLNFCEHFYFCSIKTFRNIVNCVVMQCVKTNGYGKSTEIVQSHSYSMKTRKCQNTKIQLQNFICNVILNPIEVQLQLATLDINLIVPVMQHIQWKLHTAKYQFPHNTVHRHLRYKHI